MNRMTTTLFGLALIVLLCGAASATDIYVPTDHTTIQWAVDNATAGDTIYVYNGTYNENVKVNKWLTLEGEGAGVVTVTAAAANDHVFNVTADYVNITGFNVTGATDSGKAGICLNNADHCNISDNTASNNNYGTYLYQSSSNTLTGNTASNNNYGTMLDESNDNTLTSNTASNNYRGIYMWWSSDNTLTGNDCSGNYYGIGLDQSCDNNVSCNWMHNNTYAGFYLTGGSTGNIIERNNIIANGNYNDTSDGYEWQFKNHQSDDVNTAGNCRGTNNETRINASIYDWTYVASWGNVTIEPADGVVPCAPIPELSTILLFAVGLLMIAGYVRVGRRKT
jgi:parallel beta-helix repeat protein